MLYEVLVDGDVVWSGLGNSPVQGLLRTLGNAKRFERSGQSRRARLEPSNASLKMYVDL